MANPTSRMREEILEIPSAVDRLLSQGAGSIAEVGREIGALDPGLVVTVARGSSDHICTYLAYSGELLLGVPVASIGPSVASVYHAPLKLGGSLCLSVSQSGMSPDIVEMARAAKAGGAVTVALTNTAASPLAAASKHAIDVRAGPELSVAATKSFVTSAVAGLLLLAEWKGDGALIAAIHRLPTALERAVEITWPEFREALGTANSLFTLGRGPSCAISSEAALKFKETCRIHAESYSAAEVLHGPVSIVDLGFPILAFAAADAGGAAAVAVADEIAAKGARAFVTSGKAERAQMLDCVRTDHPLTDPISLIASFYATVEMVARSRGIDPDTPRHLRKVTQTV